MEMRDGVSGGTDFEKYMQLCKQHCNEVHGQWKYWFGEYWNPLIVDDKLTAETLLIELIISLLCLRICLYPTPLIILALIFLSGNIPTSILTLMEKFDSIFFQ